QTAYDEFALKAFEESACDYLLKPFEPARLEKALAKAKAAGAAANLKPLDSALPPLTKIAVRSGDKIIPVPVDEILAFTSQDHYTVLLTASREWITDLSLTHLEEKLDPKKFIRVHRSHIVAREAIAALQLGSRMKV